MAERSAGVQTMSDDEKKGRAGKQKGELMPIMLLAAGLLIVGGGSASAIFLLTGDKSSAPAATTTNGAAASAAAEQSILAFDTFVVNLADPKRDRFMKATIRAVVTDPELENRMAADHLLKVRTRDRILSVLSARSFDEVSSPTGKETLRRDLARELNRVLPADSVDEILFAELIVQ